eukprot:7799876-Karenia_brevis.AAC.1
MYVAASESGRYGVQIWINRSLKYKLQSTRVISPRVIVVTVTIQGFAGKIAFLSCHAPHSLDPISVISSFWIDLAAAVLELRHSGCKIVLLVDANARVGSEACPFIGCYGREKENTTGTEFRTFLNAAKLYALNTFSNCGATWAHWDGTAHRIDYICLCSE